MESPNYKMINIAAIIVIGLSAAIVILLNVLWVVADWGDMELLALSSSVTILGGMVLPAVVVVLNLLGQKKYADNTRQTNIFALINVTILGVSSVIAVVWFFVTIELIAESYIGFYIGILICIGASIGLLVYGIILEIQYLLQARSSK